MSLSQLLIYLYILIGGILLARLIRQLVRIRRLAATGTQVHNSAIPEATLIETKEKLPAFAFLHYVFLGSQEHLTTKERQQVLAHELAHVRLGHSYDVLYYEVLTAIFWFNPLVWLLKTELRDVHEFQADAEVMSVFQPQEYTSLLAKEALYANGIPVGSYFQKPQVFRRLRMLQQHGRKAGLLRPLLALPLLLLLLVAFSVKSVRAGEPGSTDASTPLKENGSSASPLKTAAGAGSEESGITQPKTDDPKTLTAQPADPKPEKTRPYTYVEEMPFFNGGEAEMLQYLGSNIRFPEATKQAGIDGLVVVSFVVDMDGSLDEVSIVKSLHSAADQEALRVVKSMSGQWNPGRQNGKIVAVRYTLPIRFAMK